MEFNTFALPGPVEIFPGKIADSRGYFSETYRADAFAAAIGATEFVQENESFSHRAGTIRGIHFQTPPAAQGKLVRCLAGKLFDVAVDLRRGSPTYGDWISTVLTPERYNQMWVPPGFGHGFCTLEPDSLISYRVTALYSPEHDMGVAWDDPDLAIAWPEVACPDTLSAKDRAQPAFADLPPYFPVEMK